MHVADGLRALEALDDKIEAILADTKLVKLQEDRTALKAAIDAYVLSKRNYEDADFRLTRVQGNRRYWDTDKLEKILPRGIFKRIVEVQADPAKIDEYVRKGTLRLDLIEPALIEEPNAPYVKWTRITAKPDGGAEAASLAEKLG